MAVMKITGIIRYEGKVHVGVNSSNCRCNIRVPEKVKHNVGMIVLALLCRTISWIVAFFWIGGIFIVTGSLVICIYEAIIA